MKLRALLGLGPWTLGLTILCAQQPQPQIQNGRVETRQASGIARELAALAPASASEPVWAGWRVPIVDGHRGGCCTYGDDAQSIRGCLVDTTTSNVQVPRLTPPAAVPLEAGTGLVMLVRLSGGHVERLRTVGDDCPLDAGGRTVYWLQGVSSADSVAYLSGLAQAAPTGSLPAQEQRLHDAALSALALHRDPSVDAMLDRLAAGDADSNTRRMARSLLGSARGAHGFATLQHLLESERLPELRRQLVSAIGQTREPGTADVLLKLATSDADANVRGEAAYWLPQRGGAAMVPRVSGIVQSDASDRVRQRAVQGLARLPSTDATPLLIQLAQTSPNAAVRKEAVSALGRSTDPKAVAYLESLLR